MTLFALLSATCMARSATAFLPPPECTVGRLSCPFPEGHNYVVDGSEDEAACSVQPGAASNFLSFATDECNTTTVVGDGKETYYARLVLPPAPGPFEYMSPPIACVCEVITFDDGLPDPDDNETGASLGIDLTDWERPTPKPGSSSEVKVTGSSGFEPELRVFASKSFSTPLVAGESSPATTMLYLEIAAGSTDDQIGVLQCLTAPSSDENDVLTHMLVDDACDAGAFDVRRLESPSKHIMRIETRAFRFRNFDSVHIRCMVERCAVADATCGSCGAVRRLSATTAADPLRLVAASFGAPASTGDNSILELGESEGPRVFTGRAAAESQEGEDVEAVANFAGHAVVGAITTLILLALGTGLLTVAA